MRLGIVNEETWSFFDEIYADLTENHQTTLFKRRTWKLPVFHARANRYLFYRDLQAFMRNNDVVFFEWASGLLATATYLPKTCGIVTRLHRYEMYQWVDRINWDVVDKIFLVSQAKKREFSSMCPEQVSKIAVSSPSISLDKFKPHTKNFNGDIGIMCHMTPRKRVYDLVLTFFELTRKRDDLRLHIAGGPDPAFKDYMIALKYIVEELDLNDKVVFYDHVSDTADWYGQIDIFISNSYSEGLQVAPMEAMASGCYCLIHQWNGAKELVPMDNLFYTSSELIRKILEYCEYSDSERLKKRAEMRAWACEKFDIENTKKQIRQGIEDVFQIASR